ATTCHSIFSVRSELITLAKFAFILYEIIEWNYPALSPNTLSMQRPIHPLSLVISVEDKMDLNNHRTIQFPLFQPRISIKNLLSDSLIPIILPLHYLVLILKNRELINYQLH
ncbi:20442_t:CDS:1, partial [Gigaspora margarita]